MSNLDRFARICVCRVLRVASVCRTKRNVSNYEHAHFSTTLLRVSPDGRVLYQYTVVAFSISHNMNLLDGLVTSSFGETYQTDLE